MKTKRNLSGIYFRSKGGSVCFEDLEKSEQDRVLDNVGHVWLKSLCKKLANTINELGDNYGLMK